MLRRLFATNVIAKPFAITSRYYAYFPADWVAPITKKDEQEKLKDENKIQELSIKQIKPAPSNYSSSSLEDPTTTKFISLIMRDGQKILARNILERGFLKMKQVQLERYHLAKTDEEKMTIELNPRILLHQAIENCRPLMKTINVKRGGTNYKVPVPITEKKSYFMSMKWLIEAANDKAKTIHFPEKIAWEVLDAANNTGRVIKRKQDLHKECEANRAYAHYRWVK